MKVCVIQPRYSFDKKEVDSCFQDLLSLLNECDSSMDLIVLPEYSDALADVKGRDGFYNASKKYAPILLEEAKKLAKRCNAMVFVNAGCETENGIRNTTHAIDRQGNIVYRYFKTHPAPSEVKTDSEGGHELDVGYSYRFEKPSVFEMEGIRFGFLTCYDFYFYENYARLARENLDVIIGCSLQRTDTHEALSIINQFLCYQTNAHLIRASVSLGKDSKTCGCSSIITPKGETIVNMQNQVGLGVCEINPKEKYYKPAGFMGKQKAHYEYIEEGRRPWLYRNGGASVCLFDKIMPYPRRCMAVNKKGIMLSLGLANALDYQEICLDVQVKDGEWMAVSGKESISLKRILQKFASRVITNICVPKTEKEDLEQLFSLLHNYDATAHAYISSKDTNTLKMVKELCEGVACCYIGDEIATAEKSGVEKIWLSVKADRETYQKAKAKGLVTIALAKANGQADCTVKKG